MVLFIFYSFSLVFFLWDGRIGLPISIVLLILSNLSDFPFFVSDFYRDPDFLFSLFLLYLEFPSLFDCYEAGTYLCSLSLISLSFSYFFVLLLSSFFNRLRLLVFSNMVERGAYFWGELFGFIWRDWYDLGIVGKVTLLNVNGDSMFLLRALGKMEGSVSVGFDIINL